MSNPPDSPSTPEVTPPEKSPSERRRQTGYITTTFRKFVIWLIISGASLGINGKEAIDAVWPDDNRPVCEQLAQCQPRFDLVQDARNMRDELRDIAERFRRGEMTQQEAFGRASAVIQRYTRLTDEKRAWLEDKLRELAGKGTDFVIELWLEELVDGLLFGRRPTPSPTPTLNSPTAATPSPTQSPNPPTR